MLTGSDDGRHSNTSLAWGAGVQFNPTESVAIDIAYEAPAVATGERMHYCWYRIPFLTTDADLSSVNIVMIRRFIHLMG